MYRRSRAAFVVITLASACGSREPAAPATEQPQSPRPVPGAPTPVIDGATAASQYDVTRPCSMITADEVAAIVGFPLTMTDEQFRCKFTDAKGGWLSVSLLEASLKSAKDICEYAPSKRTNVPGVGDSASYFGSTVCVKLGDVAIIVDGANVAERSPQLQRSGAENVFIVIGKTIASRIP